MLTAHATPERTRCDALPIRSKCPTMLSSSTPRTPLDHVSRSSARFEVRELTSSGIFATSAGDYLAGYEKLEIAYKEGKLRSIGISNFDENEIEKLLANCEIVPSLIQVECHPYFPQTELKKLLAQHDIALQAWYPLGGRGNSSIMDEPVVRDLAVKYGKTPAQIIMRWHIQEGNIVIPGSKNPTHIADNIDVFDFELTDSDMAAMATLDRGKRFYERTPEKLAQYAAWKPDVENQK